MTLIRCSLGWFPPERHVVGKGGAVNWNEGAAFGVAGQAEPADAADQGVHQEH